MDGLDGLCGEMVWRYRCLILESWNFGISESWNLWIVELLLGTWNLWVLEPLLESLLGYRSFWIMDLLL